MQLHDAQAWDVTAAPALICTNHPPSRCTHCQDLEPIWRELAQKLKGEVHVGKVRDR